MRKTVVGVLVALGLGVLPGPILAASDPAAPGPLIAAFNSTGQTLFGKLARTPGNIVFSPYSIGTAMAMVFAGSGGGNTAEMAKVLGLASSPADVDAANAAVLQSLDAAASPSFQLLVANALMLTKKGDAIAPDYIATLRKDYAAEIFRGADLTTVNGWVKRKTKGKIDSILDRLDPSTALVLLDAIYFKASWQSPFNPKSTHDEAFHSPAGDANVPMMHIRGEFPLAQRPGYRAIRLPYAGGRAAMIVVLPDGDAGDVIQRLDEPEIQSLLGDLRGNPAEVDLSLPRFKANFRADLVPLFGQLGMHRAFNPEPGDFSGMTGQSKQNLAIDQIVHRAVIEVAEEGTVAAAVTGISVVATAMAPRQAETFRVDRPFVFAIVDDKTGAVLFEGRIVDPR